MKKQDFDELLKESGLSRYEFAKETGLSYGSISNWNDEKKPVPHWVESWLKNYNKAKIAEDIIRAIEPFVLKK